MSERLDEMKAYANEQNIKFHPSIGEEALEQKIREYEESLGDNAEAVTETEKQDEPIVEQAAQKPTSDRSRRQKRKAELTKLVRVRITCMNPNKKDWEGEIFTVSNSLVGTMKKYVPFGAEDGWHVPQIILNVIKEREFQHFVTVKDERGNKVPKGKQSREFSVEMLEPLTQKELDNLARTQAMAGGV